LAALAVLTACAASTPSAGESADPIPITEDWEMSPKLLDRLYQEKLENLRIAYSLDEAVDASFVRYVAASEVVQVISDCASDAGFETTPNEQGGLDIAPAPKGQEEALNRALANCEAMFPLDPRMNMKLPRVRAQAQYEFLTQTVAPCIEGLGYSLTKAPSMQAWLDSYYTIGSAWDPVQIAADQMLPADGTAPLEEIYRECPTVSDAVYPPMDF
jgi:hypothetical protein